MVAVPVPVVAAPASGVALVVAPALVGVAVNADVIAAVGAAVDDDVVGAAVALAADDDFVDVVDDIVAVELAQALGEFESAFEIGLAVEVVVAV